MGRRDLVVMSHLVDRLESWLGEDLCSILQAWPTGDRALCLPCPGGGNVLITCVHSIDRASVGNLFRCPVEAFGVQHSRDFDLIGVTGENPVEQSKGLSMEVFQ